MRMSLMSLSSPTVLDNKCTKKKSHISLKNLHRAAES